MFKSTFQLTTKRFNSHYAPSKFLKDLAYSGSKVDKKAGEEFIKKYEEKVHHSEGITNLWKKITYFVALPALLLTVIPVGQVELSHAKHREHLRHLSDDEWPVQYDYQNLRQHKYFWGDGDKTLFWNSDVNRHVEK
ncbi:cytochrome c oxidase subunit VIa [Scheffersomyces coipomensis]|uniref:cytochrome c oxidase subunit VIa n=1 Tax=Scheffersomyces coipomensis TaxID=1788519 RepID=UPI00315D6B85